MTPPGGDQSCEPLRRRLRTRRRPSSARMIAPPTTQSRIRPDYGGVDDLHPTAARVVAAAADLGLDIDVVVFPEGTRTAEDAARAVGCDVAQIVKSLVFVAGGGAGAGPRLGRQPARRGEAGGVARRRRRRGRGAPGHRPTRSGRRPGSPSAACRRSATGSRFAASSTPTSSTTTSCGRPPARRCTCSPSNPGRSSRAHRRAGGRRRGVTGDVRVIKYLGSKRKLVPVLEAVARRPARGAPSTCSRGRAESGRAWKALGVDVTAVDTTSDGRGARPLLRRDRRHGRRSGRARRAPSASSTAWTGRPGYVTEVFCSQARYFQPANGARIDAIRDAITARWAGSRSGAGAPDRAPRGGRPRRLDDRRADGVPQVVGAAVAQPPHAAPARAAAGAGSAVRGDAVDVVRQVGSGLGAGRVRPRVPRPAVQPAQLPGELPRVGDDRRRRRARALRRRLQAGRHPGGASTPAPSTGGRRSGRRSAPCSMPSTPGSWRCRTTTRRGCASTTSSRCAPPAGAVTSRSSPSTRRATWGRGSGSTTPPARRSARSRGRGTSSTSSLASEDKRSSEDARHSRTVGHPVGHRQAGRSECAVTIGGRTPNSPPVLTAARFELARRLLRRRRRERRQPAVLGVEDVGPVRRLPVLDRAPLPHGPQREHGDDGDTEGPDQGADEPPSDASVVQSPAHCTSTTAAPMIPPHRPPTRMAPNARTRATTGGRADSGPVAGLVGHARQATERTPSRSEPAVTSGALTPEATAHSGSYGSGTGLGGSLRRHGGRSCRRRRRPPRPPRPGRRRARRRARGRRRRAGSRGRRAPPPSCRGSPRRRPSSPGASVPARSTNSTAWAGPASA